MWSGLRRRKALRQWRSWARVRGRKNQGFISSYSGNSNLIRVVGGSYGGDCGSGGRSMSRVMGISMHTSVGNGYDNPIKHSTQDIQTSMNSSMINKSRYHPVQFVYSLDRASRLSRQGLRRLQLYSLTHSRYRLCVTTMRGARARKDKVRHRCSFYLHQGEK